MYMFCSLNTERVTRLQQIRREICLSALCLFLVRLNPARVCFCCCYRDGDDARETVGEQNVDAVRSSVPGDGGVEQAVDKGAVPGDG